MKKKLIALFGTLALALLPAVYAAAQEMDEAAGWQDSQRGGRMDKETMAVKHGSGGQEEMKGMKAHMSGQGGQGEMGMKERGGPGLLSEDETLAMIKKHDPAFAEKLAGFKTAAPGKYKMIIMMGGRTLSGAREADESVEKDAVRVLSLEFDTKELGLKYDKAADSDKPAVKTELRVKVSELLDLRLKGQEMRIKKMEGDLARLKKNLESRKANKTKIVDERLGQLIGEGYGW